MKARVFWFGSRSQKRKSTPEASACWAILSPNISVDNAPTKPVGAPSRAIATAILRQEPPTMGSITRVPSLLSVGMKSISASPQLKSHPLVMSLRHHRPRFAVQGLHKGKDPPLLGMERREAPRRRLG